MSGRKKDKKVLPNRMKIMFITVFFLFSILIVRLGEIQIVKGESYERIVIQKENTVVNSDVPRGKIYDRNGKLIVGNAPKRAITYTRTNGVTDEEMLDTAGRLAKMINKDFGDLTDRDKKDFWIKSNPEKAKAKVLSSEKSRIEEKDNLSREEKDKRIYELKLDRITEKDLTSLDTEDLEVLAIYNEMISGYSMTMQTIKNENVSIREFARVSEHLDELKGVNAVTDWSRTYEYDQTLQSVLGNVSSSREGIPKESLEEYLAKGYSRNDRVGTSYLELQYEQILNGKEKRIKNFLKDGKITKTEVVQQGKQGKDMVLSIDMELQREIEKIVRQELRKHAGSENSPYLDRAFVVMMDPNTGEIKALVGQRMIDKDNGEIEFQDYSLGTFTSSYESGSVVKGATLLTGYMTNSIEPGEMIVDEPLFIKGTPKKASWFNEYGQNTGPISDLFALEKSSNSYMWKVALRIAKTRYVPQAPIHFNTDAFRLFREHFAQLGLGVPTGIDLPGESSGFEGTAERPGLLLDFAIGQYDTYTPMQLAQYVSTIANGGKRIQPHILKEIREPARQTGDPGNLIYKKEPVILNHIDASERELDQVQKGFYRVFHGAEGTANLFKDAPYNAAGKSGTAESFYKGENMEKSKATYNTTLIGYAPFEHPEIAFSTVVPWSHQTHDPYINKTISKRVMDKYFQLKKERAKIDN